MRLFGHAKAGCVGKEVVELVVDDNDINPEVARRLLDRRVSRWSGRADERFVSIYRAVVERWADQPPA